MCIQIDLGFSQPWSMKLLFCSGPQSTWKCIVKQGSEDRGFEIPVIPHPYTHTAKTQGPSRKRKCRVRKRWNKSCEMLSSVPDVSFGLMIFRKPWLPAQDLHNIKPAKIPASMGQMTSENADGCKRKGNHFFCKYTQWGSHVPPDDPHAHTHKSSTKGT